MYESVPTVVSVFLSEHVYSENFVGDRSSFQTTNLWRRRGVYKELLNASLCSVPVIEIEWHKDDDESADGRPSRSLVQKGMIKSSMEWMISPSGIGGPLIQFQSFLAGSDIRQTDC